MTGNAENRGRLIPLERHRILVNMTKIGWPIYDDDDHLIGVVNEPLWDWEFLTSAEQDIVQEYADTMTARLGDDAEKALYYAQCDYGITHEHVWTAKGMEPWRECRVCGLFGEREGRPMRMPGGADMWVVGSPPPTWLVPKKQEATATREDADPWTLPTLLADEYLWNGGSYVLVEQALSDACGEG